jgi:alpha-L-glutamate ligase-like protein
MAIKPSHILGMNSRYRYTKLNPRSARKYGFSKLLTKELLKEHDIPTANVYHIFKGASDLENISWETIPTPFVIKPASGSAGKGIWVIKEKVANKLEWLNHDGHPVTDEDLSLHVSNILDGEFSTWGTQHKAIVEEMIPPHPILGKYSYGGTPDARVIVFNNVPVMAMLRLPTKESEGKANLDRGAIALGVDIATGITTYGIKGKGEIITHLPGTKKKVNGIRIPQWNQVLKTAVEASIAAGFVFMGADIFIHPEKGPMIVELNGFPGLSIQLANRAGLKKRIERVEGIEVRNAEHGCKIGQALFAESFADNIKAEEGVKIISTKPKVLVYGDRKQTMTVTGMVNTGRFRSAIGEQLANELGLVDLEDLLWSQQETTEGKVPVVPVSIKIKSHTIDTAMIVTEKLNRRSHKIELGRKDLGGFLIGEIEEE